MKKPLRLTIPDRLEHDIQADILRYLRFDRRVAWAERMNTGAHEAVTERKDGTVAKRFVRYGFPGLSDILGQLTDGRLLAIEVKRIGANPTPAQVSFLLQVTRGNGVAFVARSVDDARAHLDAAHSTTLEVASLYGYLQRNFPAVAEAAKVAMKLRGFTAPTSAHNQPLTYPGGFHAEADPRN